MQNATIAPPTVEGTVPPRKPKPDKSEPKVLRQINLRFDPAYYQEIEEAAGLLGLDVAQFLRMIVREHFPEYQVRARKIRKPPPTPEGEGEGE
jgi:hypothetical protein